MHFTRSSLSGLTGKLAPWFKHSLELADHLAFSSECVSCRLECCNGPIPVCRDCFSRLDHPLEDELRYCLLAEHINCTILHASALWYYELNGPVRALHRRLKYREGFRLGVRLGRLMGTQLDTQMRSKQLRFPDLIVPIPAHPVRERERGFNQAYVLAEGISETTKIPVSSGLIKRIVLKESQVGLGTEERKTNLYGAFTTTDVQLPTYQHLLLVDDVMTTGSTLRSAIETISRDNNCQISVALLAFAAQ